MSRRSMASGTTGVPTHPGPREVVQEVYGLLLAHLAIRTLMYQAALHDRVDPDRLSFTGALRVLRRAIPRAQRTPPDRLPLFQPAC